MFLTSLDSPVGFLTLSATDTALTGLWLHNQTHFPTNLNGTYLTDHPVFLQTKEWLTAYFKKEKLPQLPPLSPRGTPFQQAVWQQLLQIPYGKTSTYGAIAAKLRSQGLTASAQAVGGAVGRNPILILIPCHRVIGANGSLTGYAGGLPVKQKLLEIECKVN